MDSKDAQNNQMHANVGSGSAILDTYLQFITENTFGKLLINLKSS